MQISKLFSFIAVILLVSVIFAGLVMANTPATAAAESTDIMQFRYNAQHTGDYSPVAGTNAPIGGQKWTYTWSGQSTSSPTVVNGTVYIGSGDGIVAINATTGAEKWSDTIGSIGSPAVANGTVYIGGGDGYMYALDAMTGTTKWSYFTGFDAQDDKPYWIHSSPAYVDGVIYFGTCGISDQNYPFFGLYANNGTLKWSVPIPDSVTSSPAVANGVVYVGSGDHNVYALDASTGAAFWHFPTRDAVSSSPAVVNGVVYVGSNDHNVYAFDASTGDKLWNFTTGDDVITSPAVSNGLVYIGSSDYNVYGIYANNGTVKWTFPTGGYVHGSPSLANGILYALSQDANLYALNASTGLKEWSYNTGAPVGLGGEGSPAIVNGVVFVANYTSVQAVGKPAWSAWTSLGGQILAGTSPAACNVSGQTYWFVIGTNNQLYYASTGSPSWASLGGNVTASPAAVSSASGVIDVYARGSDGTLYTRHYSGNTWGVWTAVGGQLLAGTGPGAYASSNTIGLFVTGTNHQLYYKTSSSGWVSLGGYLTSSPAATSTGSGVIYVGARGSNGALYERGYM